MLITGKPELGEMTASFSLSTKVKGAALFQNDRKGSLATLEWVVLAKNVIDDEVILTKLIAIVSR